MNLTKNNLPTRKESELRFVAILKQHGKPVTREDAAKLTGYSTHHAGKYLCKLKQLGILESEKTRRGAAYVVSGSPPEPIPVIVRGTQVDKLAGIYVPPIWHIRAGAGELRRAA